MGGIFGGGKREPSKAASAKPTGLSKEYEADRPQVMPVYNSPSQLEAAKRKRLEIMSRSGRTSTNLTGNPGTATYQNSFLGNTR